MPAYFDQGFSVREPAWHGLAVVLDDYPGREDAMRLAGHNWRVLEQPVFTAPMSEGIDGYKALVREDTKKVLSVVNDSYKVIQNDTLWDIIDAIMEQERVKYETAGVLRDGSVTWVMARLNEPSQVPGDDSAIYPYILVSNSHDGSAAARAHAVSVRVVCWNTFTAAEAQSKSSGLRYTFRHTRNVMERIEEAKQALAVTRHEHEEFMQLARDLAEVKVNSDDVKVFLERFFPMPPEDVTSERHKRNILDARRQVDDILGGETIPKAHKRTAYGLWQAGIEYLDHYRRANTPETYFKRGVFDSTATKKRLAKVAAEVAG